METFSPTCDNDQIIIIDHGMYGRMSIGRCVKNDYGVGTIGCSVDVKETLEKKCSARRHCEVAVPVAEFDTKLSCLKEMRPYLEAGYSCQTGIFTQLQ